jgi:hypothetical protein
MSGLTVSPPCPGFPVAILFTDVEPHVLADEDATEQHGCVTGWSGPWNAYLNRVMPPMECAPRDARVGQC